MTSLWLTRDDTGYQGVHPDKPTKNGGFWRSSFGKEIIPSELYPESSDECLEFVIISKEEYEKLKDIK